MLTAGRGFSEAVAQQLPVEYSLVEAELTHRRVPVVAPVLLALGSRLRRLPADRADRPRLPFRLVEQPAQCYTERQTHEAAAPALALEVARHVDLLILVDRSRQGGFEHVHRPWAGGECQRVERPGAKTDVARVGIQALFNIAAGKALNAVRAVQPFVTPASIAADPDGVRGCQL